MKLKAPKWNQALTYLPHTTRHEKARNNSHQHSEHKHPPVLRLENYIFPFALATYSKPSQLSKYEAPTFVTTLIWPCLNFSTTKELKSDFFFKIITGGVKFGVGHLEKKLER